MATKTKIPDFFQDDDEDFSQKELDFFKNKLEQERQELKGKLSKRIEGMTDEDRSADELDQAGRMADQAFLLRLADKERKKLGQIDGALKKFEQGEFGLCEGTGENISRKRLLLRPWTRYSIEYKEQLEHERKQGHPG